MPVTPPDIAQPPKWAQTLVQAANTRNRARQAPDVFSMLDLAAAWTECGGRCSFSGLPFGMEIVGDGQARRPFAPSLDRIDRHQPYRRDNVRLVTAVANFARNAWGDNPVLQLAGALHRKHGDLPMTARTGPPDGDLDTEAVMEMDRVETEAGTLAFPPQADMCEAILGLLGDGPHWSRTMEDILGERFGITRRMRRVKLRNGCPIWRNHVAWALVHLGRHASGTGQIERIETGKAPDGASTGRYRLTAAAGVA